MIKNNSTQLNQLQFQKDINFNQEEILPGYQSPILESKIFLDEDGELNVEQIIHDRKLRDDMKSKEEEQTQKLLIALTNELFEKVERINKMENQNKSEVAKSEDIKTSNQISKIEFTDISWYREKLYSEVSKK